MNIIVVGAGAAGLIAAKTLASQGQTVTILEARNRIGGRVHTFEHENITLEGGAEFIHGNLTITLKSLKEAGLEYHELTGDFWRRSNNQWQRNEGFLEHEDLLLARLKNMKHDMSIEEFLAREFAGDQYTQMRNSLLSYVEGYYAGDPSRTSSAAFLHEWENEDEQQYRPKGGYGKLIQYLAEKHG